MKTEIFKGKDFITLLDWKKEDIETVLKVALDLKQRFAMGEIHDDILRAKTLFMIFYNQSLRTRNSFEAGMTQLGGHAHFLDPGKIYTPALPGKEVAYSTERVSDVARVLARMGNGIAIRCYGDPVDWVYGGSNELLQNFAYWAGIPVLNMEDDKYHPFQALADVLTVYEKFGTFSGVKFVMSWAYSPSIHKPRAVPQSAIIGASMMGMDVTLAHPPEMSLDPEVIDACEKYAQMNQSSFQIVHDFEEAAEGADVLYPKAWAPFHLFKPPVGEDDPKLSQEIFDRYKDWKATPKYMELANPGAVYMHCLPADRGWEVEDDVIDNTDPEQGWRSVVYDEAENRLHVQKAVMSLVMR
jgi:ornithine carbamoyltransferase